MKFGVRSAHKRQGCRGCVARTDSASNEAWAAHFSLPWARQPAVQRGPATERNLVIRYHPRHLVSCGFAVATILARPYIGPCRNAHPARIITDLPAPVRPRNGCMPSSLARPQPGEYRGADNRCQPPNFHTNIWLQSSPRAGCSRARVQAPYAALANAVLRAQSRRGQ